MVRILCALGLVVLLAVPAAAQTFGNPWGDIYGNGQRQAPQPYQFQPQPRVYPMAPLYQEMERSDQNYRQQRQEQLMQDQERASDALALDPGGVWRLPRVVAEILRTSNPPLPSSTGTTGS